jgi:hypothetical protein
MNLLATAKWNAYFADFDLRIEAKLKEQKRLEREAEVYRKKEERNTRFQEAEAFRQHVERVLSGKD